MLMSIFLSVSMRIYNTEVYFDPFTVNAIKELMYILTKQSEQHVSRELFSYNKKLSMVCSER